MIDVILGTIAIWLAFVIVITSRIVDNAFKRGHEEGWDDCYKAHKQFEMSEDDILVLEAMKKSLKEHIRQKKYVKDEDRKALNDVKDFEEFKHLVFLTCIYRKEMANRK